MRQQRAKRYRKAMALYHTSFQFREPYQVLLSSDFILAAQRFKLDMASLLRRTLQGPLKLMITQCSISELYATKDQASIAMAKTCERRRCGHIPDPLPNHQCLTSCVNISGENKHRYVLATQDDALRVEMRLVPGVPMVYIRRAVMIMEPPSPATLTKREVLEREKLGGGGNPGKRKRDGDGDGVEESGKKKKKRGPKEPNPLSVKKKKKESKYGGTHSESDHGKTNNPGDENDKRAEIEGNVIGKVTESVRRLKSTRKRKHHKRAFMSKEQLIPEK